MPSAALPAANPKWYSNRVWCAAALFAVLVLCSLNVAKLMGTAHSGVEVVTAAGQGSTLQVGTLAGPADAATSDGVESGKFSNGPTPTTASSLADSIVATLSQFTNSTSKSIREWMVVVPANSTNATEAKAADTQGEPEKKFVPAELPPAEVWSRSGDACADALKIPKVAILFLTKGDLFHHAVWRLWFQSAAGALAGPGAGDDDAAVIDAQHLFSVYVHAPPGVQDSSLPPLFQGRLVSRRIDAAWGSHGLVEAARNLLWEAYKEPTNQRFMLVSESDIPLYDPMTMYQQLVSEEGSRVNGCAHSRTDRRRWTWRMRSANLKAYHWRKSTQWFMLTRPHAELVLGDTEVYRRFEEHCWYGWDNDYRRWRDCFSDEHYMPTLFAVHKIQTDSNCGAVGVAATNWSGGAHPRSYSQEDVTPALLTEALRSPQDGCDAQSAWEAAQKMFVKVDEAFNSGLCKVPLPEYESHLTSLCKVTARKFPVEVVQQTATLFTDCDNGLHLLAPGVCAAHAEQGGESLS